MIQEESGLFQVRLNEEGKSFIRRFVAISYSIQVLVFFIAIVNIYWNIKMIIMRINIPQGPFDSPYFRAVPYLSTVASFGILIANLYYLSFPRALYRSLKLNDEFGANQSFRVLLRGAYLFLGVLLVNALTLIWSLVERLT